MTKNNLKVIPAIRSLLYHYSHDDHHLGSFVLNNPSFLSSHLARIISDPVLYARHVNGVALRPYQAAPLARILDSIQNGYGDTIIIVFPRQSGKDELLHHLKVFLLDLYSTQKFNIIEVNPTESTQNAKACRRFDQLLAKNPLIRGRWRRYRGIMRILDQATVTFLSGDASSNVVGSTASILIVNEAQAITPHIYHKNFVPMTASTNATCVIAGTIWDSDSLLSQEIRAARQAQEQDGRQRLFMVDASHVRAVLPAYGRHVDAWISKLGRDHPAIKTQYFNEELDAQSGMFTAIHLANIKADRPPQDEPQKGSLYAFLIDVAGQDEARTADPFSALQNPDRDSTTLSIVEVELSTCGSHGLRFYRPVHRRAWLGENHIAISNHLQSLFEIWSPLYIVLDTTGVGESLWTLLMQKPYMQHRLISVKYTASLKSEIGYGFLACINMGRFHDCAPTPQVEAQYRACQLVPIPGPQKHIRWYVPEGKRGPDGALIHDDYLMADSLVSILDKLDWYYPGPALFTDPIFSMDEWDDF